MNGWFVAAAIASALTLGLHILWGGRDVAWPLLANRNIDPIVQFTLYYCWHLATILIAALALSFAYAAMPGSGTELAFFASGIALCNALWSLAMIARYRLSLLQFGQWALFMPIGLLGLIGLLA